MSNVLNVKDIYNSSIRAVTVVFGSLFDKLYVRTYNKDGTAGEFKKVPLVYSEKQEYYLWLEQTMRTPAGKLEVGRLFPRISYVMSGLSLDTTNRMNPNIFHIISRDTNKEVKRTRVPNSYLFNFELSIWTKTMDDSIQILDYILPMFSPEISIKIKEKYNLNIVNDIKIVLSGINKEDNYLDGTETNRIITYNISFDVFANIVPNEENATIINEVIVNLQDNIDNTLQKYVIEGNDPEFLDVSKISETIYEYPDIPNDE